jgi:PhnB protein
MAVKPIPDGYHSVTPYLVVKGAASALDFYKRAFGAVVLYSMPGPGGCVMHSEFKIGDSILMMADEFPERGAVGPQTLKGTPIGLMIYVKDVDAVAKQAVAAGAKELQPVQDQFYGDRSGTFIDPYGHKWTISTHKEDLTPEEIGKRAEAFMKKMAGGGA